MTYKQILNKIEEIGLTFEHFGKFAQDGSHCYIYDNDTNEELEVDLMGILKDNFGEVVLAETSYFHDGYECWCVYSFKEHNVHIKFSAYFSSYDETEWDESDEVFPEEKTIIVFNRK